MPARAAPTAIPAIAPVESPPVELLLLMFVDDEESREEESALFWFESPPKDVVGSVLVFGRDGFSDVSVAVVCVAVVVADVDGRRSDDLKFNWNMGAIRIMRRDAVSPPSVVMTSGKVACAMSVNTVPEHVPVVTTTLGMSVAT